MGYLPSCAQVHEAILRVELRRREDGRQRGRGRCVEDLVDVLGVDDLWGWHLFLLLCFFLCWRGFGWFGFLGLKGGWEKRKKSKYFVEFRSLR